MSKRNDWIGLGPAKPDEYVAFEERMKLMFAGIDALSELSDAEVEAARQELIANKLRAVNA